MNDLLNNIVFLRVCLGIVIMILIGVSTVLYIRRSRKPDYLKAYWHSHDDFDSFRKSQGAFGERKGIEYKLIGKYWIQVRNKK